MDASYAGSYHERGKLHFAMSRFDDAAEDAKTALAVKPDFAEAGKLLYDCLLILGRQQELAEQVKAWEESRAGGELSFTPEETAGLLFGQAWLKIAQHDLPAALDTADRAVAAAPAWWHSYVHRAAIRQHLGSTDGIEADCTHAAAIELSSPEELVARGLALSLEPCFLPGIGQADVYARQSGGIGIPQPG